MIYFSPHEHAVACVTFLCLGGLFGILYRSINTFLDFITKLIFVIIDVFKSNSPFPHKQSPHNKRNRHLLDFLFFLIFGISYVLFSYVTLDGEIRIYSALIFISSFAVFEKLLSLPIEYALRFAFEKTYSAIYFVAYWIILPLKAFLKLIGKMLYPHINRIKIQLYKRSFRTFIAKECNIIEKFIFEMR